MNKQQNLKHQPKLNKKTTTTKVLNTEYAIMQPNGEVLATDKEEEAIQQLKEGKQVYVIKTYSMTFKQTKLLTTKQ